MCESCGGDFAAGMTGKCEACGDVGYPKPILPGWEMIGETEDDD